ncbi:MAG: TonB-dependent receptor [Acidobacteria bacterium]|nr:TonB-dependent receptor [Acidobacteriota bacterium]MCW5948102.1 TonB-dependent receptor [Pyrinomonadaceae bacterium]
MIKKIITAAFAGVLMFTSQAFAQSQGGTGQIAGIVSDATGAVVPNATVKLTSNSTGISQTVTADSSGNYRFVLLQPGKYALVVTAASFGESKLEVEVQVGRVTDANVTLVAGNVSAVVEVAADGVQTTTSNFDAVQNEQAITNLPINGRRFQDFVTLTPTAQVDPSRGQISLSGQRGINSNINVDGVDYNQPFFGGIRGGERSNSAFTIPQESIREFQVVAAGYSAEFGRSSGGIVNVATKSGGNTVRGSAFYLIRPKQLARGNSFAKALADQRLNALGLEATLAPTQHQWGGSIGGPIVKNRLFYFGSYEQQRFRAPRQVLFQNLVGISTANLTNAAAQTEAFNFYRSNEVQYQATNDAIAALGKIDGVINSKNRFNVRYNYSTNKALNAVSTGETALDPTTTLSLSTNGTERDRNHIVVGQFISNFTSNILNEARFQFARETRPRTPNQLVANINTSVGVYGTRNFLPTTQFDRRIQFADALTVISGGHTFKFGGEFSNIHADQTFGFNQTGVYTFSGLTSTLGTGTVGAGILDAIGTTRTATFRGRFDTTTARYNLQVGNLAAAYTVKELAFYAQDSWRVNSKLTLNYGLRYEKQFNPSAEANNSAVLNLIRNTNFPMVVGGRIDPATIPDSQNQWGPRLGFAYDPRGDGKTVVRGFVGQYFARTPLLVLAAPFNNFRNPAGDLSVTLGSPAFTATGFSQANFDAQNPQYVAIVGGTGFTPNTVYRQFAILGIDLNTRPLGGLPILTPQQVATIQTAILNATTNPPTNLGVYQGANFVGITPNFKNPQSFQYGGGVEHQLRSWITIGLDFSVVNTIYLQRNRDINLPAPTGVDAVSGRVLVNRASRPLTNIGTLQLRDSSARSLYKSLTARVNFRQKWGRINAFYTLSRSTSNDDNERDAGGVLYDNPYDLSTEYYNSRLDRRHQFVANPVFYLKYGFEVSSAMRFRSGNPVNSLVGTDLNADGNNNERPMIVPGVELPRNYFTNRPIWDIDLRVQKGFKFGENRRIVFSSEFFNVLNRSNLQISGSATTNYCSTSNNVCGLSGITNINFMNIIQQTPTATNFGKLNLSGLNPGSQVFQMQLGARLYF